MPHSHRGSPDHVEVDHPSLSCINPTAKATNNIIAANTLPPTIMGGIVDLVIAFPAGPATSDADRARKLQIYGEALADFEVSVGEYVLKRMRIFNPRNPFPPTAQDLFEECERVRKLWCGRVQRYFVHGSTWGSPDVIEQLQTIGRRNSNHHPFGPPPFAAGCWITPAMIEEFLLPAIANSYDEMRNREKTHEHRLTEFEEIADERFNKIPEVAFDGKRQEIAALRRHRRERKAEIDKKRQHLLTKFRVGETVIDAPSMGCLRGVVEEIDERNDRVIVRFNRGKEAFRIWGKDFAKLELAPHS